MMANTYADNADNIEWERQRRNASRCQCSGQMPGRCPGPANCPMCQDDRPEAEAVADLLEQVEDAS